MVIEVCANSLTSAIAAQKAGAHRVELCQNLWCGGTTPSAATIEWAREYLDIELVVLIRPRSGDFCYSEYELKVIERDILFCKERNIDGIVVGTLFPDGRIDIRRMELLQRLAHPMKITFHRAFDFTSNPFFALSQLIEIGIDRVLTSGLQPTAILGQQNIKSILDIAKDQISIIAGGGLNAQNISSFVETTGIQEIHLSGKKTIESPFQMNQMQLNKGEIPEFDFLQTCENEIEKVIRLVQEIGTK